MEIDEKQKTEESSTSVAVVDEKPVMAVEDLTDTQRSKWLETGKLPPQDAKKEEKSQAPAEEKVAEEEATPASKEEPAEKEKTAESVPAVKQEKAEIPPHEARIKQLVAEKKILEQRLADKERQPEKVKETEEPEPNPEDYETQAEYLKAKVDHSVSQAVKKDRLEREAEQTRVQIETKNKETIENWNKSVVEAKKKYSDFEQKVFDGEFQVIEGSVLDRWCLKSKMGTDVLYYYATHPEEFSKLSQIVDPVEAVQEIARLEIGVLDKPKPAPKVVSDVPPPPKEVSGRGTATDDPIAEALASGDMEKYMKLANEKERASLSRK